MIFGRKRKSDAELDEDDLATTGVPAATEEEPPASAEDAEEGESALEEAELAEADEDELEDAEPDEEPEDAEDYRADGPFDIDEVDLGGDGVTRVDLGSLIITPWPGLNLQLQVNEATRQVQAITGIWQNSGIEVALFAAPASGGLADELREDLVEEAEQAGGNAQLAPGPFGTEVRRVLPQTGPKGEQLFHVSRIWFAEGPRWLLRASLLGEAALADVDEPKARPFVEFFRNLVVRRGNRPMVPGEQITMELPKTKEG